MIKFKQEPDAMWDDLRKITWLAFHDHKCGLEKEFGKGFCKKHPEVLASLVQSTMTAWGNALIAAAIQDSQKK